MVFGKRTLLFAFLLIIFNLKSGFSQQVRINLTTLNSSNPISQNSIQAIFKDSYGLMWFGTQDGLNRFDGYQVQVYKHLDKKANTLPANSITAISEDPNKNIWAGTRKDGLSRFDRRNRIFINYRNKAGDPNSLSNNNITALLTDKQSNLLVGTRDGLNIYSPKTNSFRRFSSVSADNHTLSNPDIRSIYQDAAGNIWIGTANGLNLFDKKTGKFSRYFPKASKQITGSIFVSSIVEDDEHNLWIGTNTSLYMFNTRTKEFNNYQIGQEPLSPNNQNTIYCLAKADNNRIWVGTNAKLLLFDVKQKKQVTVMDETDSQTNLPNDGIFALLEDKTNRLWIGTTTEGVLKYDRNLTVFPSYKTSPGVRSSGSNVIRAVAEDEKQNLYLGTDAGLSYYDRKTQKTTTYQHSQKNNSSLLSNYTSTVILAKKTKAVWVGTFGSGLDRLDPGTGKFTHYFAGPEPTNLNSNDIQILLEDRKGNIYVGTKNGGINIISPDSRAITKLVHNSKDPNGLSDNIIMALLEDRNGSIWIGGYSNGISIYNPVTRKFTSINKKNSLLSCDIIGCFYEDRRGNIWIGTLEGGLNCYNPKTKKFKVFSEENGFINNTINYIDEDKNGYIWVSTNHGITRLNPNTGKSKNFGLENGLKTLEFNLASGTKLRSGELVFGGINGFNVVNPKNIIKNTNIPPVVLTGLEVLNKRVKVGDKDSILKQNILQTAAIKLSHKQLFFAISFSALDYTSPNKNQFAYKLEGFDEDWIYVGNQRKATYTNLNPGTYTFMVKAANNDGIWSTIPTKLEITIVPAFWMTWYFRLGVSILLLSLAYGFYIYRLSYVKKQNLKLERLVKKRTRKIGAQARHLLKLNEELQSQSEEVQAQSEELQVQSEELQAQSIELSIKTKSLESLNLELQIQKDEEEKARLLAEEARHTADKANLAKSTFLATMSHEIRTPLNGVLGMVSLLSHTELDREQQEYTTAIANSGESLMNVINDVLDYSKIESGNLELDYHEFGLRKCLSEVFSLFALKVSQTDIVLESTIGALVPELIFADSFRLKQILINLVGNAMKFTNHGKVHVSVSAIEQTDSRLRLEFKVSDTGIGIAEEQIQKLFRPFNQIDSSISRQYGGSGLGLVICAKLTKLMGGNITVTSQQGKGSCFMFDIVVSAASPALGISESTSENNNEPRYTLSETFAVRYPMNLLVAEDNLMNQKLIMRILNKLGYMPDLANHGAEVISILKEKQYDLILMDMQMPQMDGIQATRLIRKTYGMAPLIMAMTANAMNEDKESCLKAGMNDYISKPLDIELLTKKLGLLHASILATKRQAHNIL